MGKIFVSTVAIFFVLLIYVKSENYSENNNELVKISDNLFLYKDCCNVYLIKDKDNGILIDFGSGKILNNLSIAPFPLEWTTDIFSLSKLIPSALP